MSGLRAPLDASSVHLCIDMQRIFARDGIWPTPWLERVLPNIVSLADRHPERSVFTRFVTPYRADDAPGRWSAYFRKWPEATREHLDGSLLDLVPPLQRFVPPGRIVDKAVYSAFADGALHALLRRTSVGTVIITGSETDVCVLASTLAAIDLGYRVVVVSDGICSSADETHDAMVKVYSSRFDVQLEFATTAEVLDAWPRV